MSQPRIISKFTLSTLCLTALAVVCAICFACVRGCEQVCETDRAAIQKGYIQESGRWVAPARD